MNKLFHCLAFFSVFLITFTACNQQPKATAEAGCNLDTFLNAYIDSTVRPQDDFFHFSMGKWVKNNPVPASERSWGIWSKVNEENYDRMKNINEEASSKNAEAGTNWQKSVTSGTQEWILLLLNNKAFNLYHHISPP